MSTILQDANSQKWLLGVTDAGELTTTAVGSGTVSAPVLIDVLATVAFVLGVDTGGLLTLDVASASGVGCVDLVSPNGTAYDLMVTALGELVLYYGTSALEVGQLYPQNGAYPRQAQPGGIGTPVTSPVQSINEKTGRYASGCGHFFNNWDVRKAAICQSAVALICCPICLYIQTIIRPYSAIHTPPYALIGS